MDYRTDLAKLLPASDACPACHGTGKPDRVRGGEPHWAFGRIVGDEWLGRTTCRECRGFGVWEETLRAIYEDDDCLAIIMDDAVEAALIRVTGMSWRDWDAEWEAQDEEAAQGYDPDDAYDEWVIRTRER